MKNHVATLHRSNLDPLVVRSPNVNGLRFLIQWCWDTTGISDFDWNKLKSGKTVRLIALGVLSLSTEEVEPNEKPCKECYHCKFGKYDNPEMKCINLKPEETK